MIYSAPTELQLDALREVANVGCGHAANALSKLVGGRAVRIEVPRVVVTRSSEMAEIVGGKTARVVVTSLDLVGDLEGRLLLVLQEDDAQQLSSQLLIGGQPSARPLQLSAIAEAGNIVASACLNAIGTFTGFRLLPSTPTLSQDTAGAILHSTVRDLQSDSGMVTVLEARFMTTSSPLIRGQLLVVPRRSSLDILLHRLGL